MCRVLNAPSKQKTKLVKLQTCIFNELMSDLSTCCHMLPSCVCVDFLGVIGWDGTPTTHPQVQHMHLTSGANICQLAIIAITVL